MDEVGSRVHITNINVPKNIIDIEHQIEQVKEQKVMVVRSQQYEEAARLRDSERKLNEELEKAKKIWEDESKSQREVVTEENVAEVVAMMTDSVQKVAEKGGRLINMAEGLRGSVIGQDEAIKKVVKAIQRNRAGLKDPNKPVGSFIFRSNRCWKTQLCKVLAKYLFDSQDALVRIDMSEYMEKFAVSRLIGAPQVTLVMKKVDS